MADICATCSRPKVTIDQCIDGDGALYGALCWREAPVFWPGKNMGREACDAIGARGEVDPVLAEILADSPAPAGERCLAHLPSDQGGWNDGARAHYERVYGQPPLCTCPAELVRLRELAERHAHDDANDGGDTVEVVLGALRELAGEHGRELALLREAVAPMPAVHEARNMLGLALYPGLSGDSPPGKPNTLWAFARDVAARLGSAEALLKTARDHLSTAADIITHEVDMDEEDVSDERELIAEIDAYFAPPPSPTYQQLLDHSLVTAFEEPSPGGVVTLPVTFTKRKGR